MIPISIAIFILMLVAAILGFALAGSWLNKQVQKWQHKAKELDQSLFGLQENYQKVLQHSNNLQTKQSKLRIENEEKSKKIKAAEDIITQLENDKNFIFKEHERFKKEVVGKLRSNQKVLEAFEELKEKNQRTKIKSDKWKVRYHDTLASFKELESELLSLRKDKKRLEQQINASDNSHEVLEWESNYKELKLRFLALAKEKKDFEEKWKTSNEAEQGLNAQIEHAQKRNQSLLKEMADLERNQLERERQAILGRIESRAQQLDFSRIGSSKPNEADDLKNLKGLGPSLEKRFNTIGIYHFRQLASLSEQDEVLLCVLLEIPVGKIQQEEWVRQARERCGWQEDAHKILHRIGGRKDRIDLKRIGEASPGRKDNLQLIKGIGPFIEQKLNALGIFRFQQLSQLREEDVDEINEIIELAPGHIEEDDWVGQAKRMK